MVSSKATSVDEYLASLPEDRRSAMAAVRDVIRRNLPRGFEEGMQYGMIGYSVPLSRYPDTYNGQPLALAGLASQKQYMSVYLMAVYGDPDTLAWFTERYRASGKKLDMGKSCVRFKKLDDLPLELIGETIASVSAERFIATFERGRIAAKERSAKEAGAKKTTAKKTAAKKTAAKKTAAADQSSAGRALAKGATRAKRTPAKKTASKPSARTSR